MENSFAERFYRYGCHDVDNSFIRFADEGGWNNAYLWIRTIKNAKTSTSEGDETYRNTVNWNYYDQRDLKWWHVEIAYSYDRYVGSWWAGDNNSGGHHYWDQSNEVDQWVQGTESFSSSSDLTGFWWFIGMYQVPVCSVACGVNAYLISMLVGRMRRLHTSLW